MVLRLESRCLSVRACVVVAVLLAVGDPSAGVVSARGATGAVSVEFSDDFSGDSGSCGDGADTGDAYSGYTKLYGVLDHSIPSVNFLSL